MDIIIRILLAMVILYVVVKLFAWPIKMFFKLLLNSIVGIVFLYLFNGVVAPLIGFELPINIVTSLIVGILGIPGFILVAFLQYFSII